MLKFLLFQGKQVTPQKPPSPALDVRSFINRVRKINGFQVDWRGDDAPIFLLSRDVGAYTSCRWDDEEKIFEIYCRDVKKNGEQLRQFDFGQFVNEALFVPGRYDYSVAIVWTETGLQSEENVAHHLLKVSRGKYRFGYFTKPTSRNEILVVTTNDMTKYNVEERNRASKQWFERMSG